MKTGIFETEHFEGAYPVIQLFDMPGNTLVIFTNAETYERFADLFKENVHRYQWIILDKSGSRLQFFWRMYRAAQKHKLDIFYFNTISSNHLLFATVMAALRKPRLVVTVHDINCLFRSRWSLQARQLLHHIGKKAIVRLVKEFNVVSDTMVDYLQQTTRGKCRIHNIPGAVFESEQTTMAISDYIHLVVPGTLDKKRRDYSQVFALLQAAEARQLPLHVTLLGGHNDVYGAAVIQQAAAFKSQYTKLFFYDARIVLQDEFDKQLNNAHFIFIPSVIDTAICFAIPETYGLTKSSGNIFDVIKHARPFIVPQGLRTPATLESSCVRYNTHDELLDFLTGLLQQTAAYQQWQQQALANSKEYTTDKVRERNALLFDQGLKKNYNFTK